MRAGLDFCWLRPDTLGWAKVEGLVGSGGMGGTQPSGKSRVSGLYCAGMS